MKALYIMNDQSFDLVYPPDVRRELEALAEIYAPKQTKSSVTENPATLRDVEVIFSGWGGPKLDEEFLKAAPNLKALFYGAGTIKQIATEQSWNRGIVITTAAFANAIPVAEYTLSQILFCLKDGWRLVREIQKDHKYPAKPLHVSGAFRSTVGLISLSKVGRIVCELLKPFDIDVIAYDPFVKSEEAKELNVKLCSIEDIFENADIVSLHAPLLEETRGMITGEHFKLMKSYSSFINTARGAIIREEEMIEVLKERGDITAVLDVTFPEPPVKESPLYSLPNVILTPHLAGSVGQECGRMGSYMLEEFKRYLSGEELKWQVTREQFEIMA